MINKTRCDYSMSVSTSVDRKWQSVLMSYYKRLNFFVNYFIRNPMPVMEIRVDVAKPHYYEEIDSGAAVLY